MRPYCGTGLGAVVPSTMQPYVIVHLPVSLAVLFPEAITILGFWFFVRRNQGCLDVGNILSSLGSIQVSPKLLGTGASTGT